MRKPKHKRNGSGKGKPWRDFEKLVAKIEETLCPKGAVVTSPDHLPDLQTGTFREVDASIRYEVGSVPILITIECRDRTAKQDITWIEQLSTKRKNLGASATIGVSQAGFSKEAKLKSLQEGIQLRKLDKITKSDIDSLLTIEVKYDGCRIINCNVSFDTESTNFEEFALNDLDGIDAVESSFNAKIVNNIDGSPQISIKDIFDRGFKQALSDKTFEHVKIGENGESEELRCELLLPGRELFVVKQSSQIFISKVTVSFVLVDKHDRIVTNGGYQYSDASTGENLVVSYKFTNDDDKSFYSEITLQSKVKLNDSSLVLKERSGAERIIEIDPPFSI